MVEGSDEVGEAEKNGESSGVGAGGEEEAAMKMVEPFQATVWEKGLAIFVLALMASAMAFVAFTVVQYWSRIGV